MDIDNLTREGFIDLVDQMLEILYDGSPRNYKNKINKLIKLFCNNPLKINNISQIINHGTGENYNVEKIQLIQKIHETLSKYNLCFL